MDKVAKGFTAGVTADVTAGLREFEEFKQDNDDAEMDGMMGKYRIKGTYATCKFI